MKQEQLFYIARPEQNEAGPYDLVQMAGLLRRKIITVETPTRREGEQDWKPFGEHPQFFIAKEMPADATSTRVVALDEEARTPNTPIPLPSRETLAGLGMAALLILAAGGLSYGMARSDPVVGQFLANAGAGISLAALCLIMARLFDEDWLTIAMVIIIPLYDIFYFLSNIREYFPWFCMKYAGAAVAAGAALGLAASAAR